jgi:DNA polymerase V
MEMIQPTYQRAQNPEIPDYAVTGFQSPAHDYRANNLSLDELLIRVPHATFFTWVDASQIDGIETGDLLVVNRSCPPMDARVVIAVVDGKFALRRMHKKGKRWLLLTDQGEFPRLVDENIMIWGLVDATVRLHWR